MMKTNKPLGLYLHIPFCLQKCRYCDFLSFEQSDRDLHKAYLQAVKREINYYGKIYRNKYYVDSIFIGGGTPSVLEEALTAELLDAVRAAFSLPDSTEITIEANPKTLTRNKLNVYGASGINRLSIGAQSLDDDLLQVLGRVHSAEDVIETYHMARDCGFENINLDLMFAIPGQTMDLWLQTMNRSLGLEPDHISFYSLQLEEGTPFFQAFMNGSLTEISDEIDREMYHKALQMLKASGYVHYEISNAAKEGCECRHNLKYWSMEEYLGLGLGAHSYISGTRFSNQRDVSSYLKANPEEIVQWSHTNTEQDNISEYIFTGMRKLQGISLRDFERRFGTSLLTLYAKETEQYRKECLVEIKEDRLRFTEKGIDLSNRVLADFV